MTFESSLRLSAPPIYRYPPYDTGYRIEEHFGASY
jgi:hypothetical protein